MDAVFSIGQRVAVNIGGCRENRTEGVITQIKYRPELTTYEVAFPGLASDGRIETHYMAENLTPV